MLDCPTRSRAGIHSPMPGVFAGQHGVRGARSTGGLYELTRGRVAVDGDDDDQESKGETSWRRGNTMDDIDCTQPHIVMTVQQPLCSNARYRTRAGEPCHLGAQ